MNVIPAIDIRRGRCVRLVQGRPEEETVFSDDPLAVARRWTREGAQRLHVVNLDGAFSSDANGDAAAANSRTARKRSPSDRMVILSSPNGMSTALRPQRRDRRGRERGY